MDMFRTNLIIWSADLGSLTNKVGEVLEKILKDKDYFIKSLDLPFILPIGAEYMEDGHVDQTTTLFAVVKGVEFYATKNEINLSLKIHPDLRNMEFIRHVSNPANGWKAE